MPANYLDFGLFKGEYGVAKEFYDEDAIILAVRNLLLSKPGNFPFNPSIGLNIKQYQFDILDDTTLYIIESKIQDAIIKYIPELGDVEVYVRKVEDENGKPFLGIAILSPINGEKVEANFLIDNNGTTLKVFNEIR